MKVTLEQLKGDVTQVPADVLLLKHAQGFHGVDAKVAAHLMEAGLCAEETLRLEPWQGALLETRGLISARHVFFLGTPGLGKFSYPEMRRFAGRAIDFLRRSDLSVRTLTTTVHGAGYGLDIEESLLALVAGFQDGLAAAPLDSLSRIIFVEMNLRRAEIMAKVIQETPELLASPPLSRPVPRTPQDPVVEKPRVFVAMPFGQDFDDVYQFGIYEVVRRCGLVCERVDQTALTGSLMDQIREGIHRSRVVVADLTAERPNVYLEVGLAWGLGRDVVLTAREGTRLHFDLSHHRCIFYKTIGKLAEELDRTLRLMLTPKPP